MSSRRLANALIAISFVLCYFAPASMQSLYAQDRPSSIDLIFGRRPKPKDFNQPPDPKEFQPPVNGEYRATPAFFEARSDQQRCAAIDLWLSSIRYEATNATNRRYRQRDGEIDMDGVDSRSIPLYGSADFRNIFGRGLAELSEKDVKKIGKSLNQCSHQRWVTKLEWTFTNNRVAEWATEFEKYETTAKERRIAREKDRYRELYLSETRVTGYPLAEWLHETEKYRLHAAFLNNGYSEWCVPAEKQAVVGLVWKVDQNSAIRNNDEYWRRVETEVLPVTRTHCPGAETVYLLNYVDRFYIDFAKNKVDAKVDPAHPSDAINIGVYSPAGRAWMKGDALSKLTGSTSRRTPRNVAFRTNAPDQVDDGSLASIATLRTELKLRQERYEAEEKVRREREAAAAAVRKAEEERRIEAEKRERIRQKLDSHRSRAAVVLRYQKRGAPPSYSFAGYANRESLADLYAGNFEPFAGDYESDNDIAARSTKNLLSGYFEKNLDRALSEMSRATAETMAIGRKRVFLKMAFYAYHKTYAEMCFSNKEIPWMSNSLVWITTDRWGNRTEGEPVSLPVRFPFQETFNKIYENNVGERGERVALATPDAFFDDFRRLLRAEGCASPAVRQFEINLYLAHEWLLPVQELNPTGVAPKQPVKQPVAAVPEAKSGTITRRFAVSNAVLLSDLELKPGDKISIDASGSISLGVFAGSSSPRGIPGFEDFSLVPGEYHGALLVRFRGEQWKACNTGCTFTALRAGVLEFAVNDKDSANNSGSYQIQLEVTRAVQ